jgi:tetratricopeptide (TPR) repeat protein
MAGLLVSSSIVGCHPGPGGQGSNALQRPAAVEQYIAGARSYQQGDLDRASGELATAVRANPNLVMARIMLADIYVQRSDYKDAKDQYQTLTRLDPYTAANFYGLGLSEQFLNELRASVDNYLHALELDPNDAKSAANLGAVYLSLDDVDNAAKYLERATTLDPKSWYAWLNLGLARDAKGQYKDAEAAYRRAQELDSGQPSVLFNLASNLVTQARPVEAMSIFKQLIERDAGNARYHKRYADALVVANRTDDADKEYREALRVDPRYYPAMNELGLLLITRYKREAELDDDKKRSALDFWRQSLAVNPDQPRIKALIAEWGPRDQSGKI